MITLAKAYELVVGVEYALLFILICTLISTIIFFLFRQNRNMRSFVLYGFGFFISLGVCDIIWYEYFFPLGEYINHGIVSMYVFFLYPILLLMVNTGLTSYAYVFDKNKVVKIKQVA